MIFSKHLQHFTSKFNLKSLFTISLFGALTLAATSSAQPALDFSSLGNGRDYYQGSYSLGWNFTTNQDVSVNALAFYDDLTNGLTSSHEVGIFDGTTCEKITSTTVDPSDPLSGFFRYHDITPVVLTAGKKYYIAAVTGTEKYAIDVTTLNVDPSITFGGFSIFGSTQTTNTLQCPNGSQADGFHGDFGPTFRIGTGGPAATPTPDPQATPDTRRATATVVLCNRGPQPGDYFQCTATVGPTDNQQPPPSGIVKFSTTDSKGSFPFGTSCQLGLNQSPQTTSFCTVTYANTTLGAGTVVPVIADYQGDSIYLPSSNSGKLPKTTVARLPKKPLVCFSEKKDACKGLNAIIDPLQFRPDGIGYITSSYYGPLQSKTSPAIMPRSIRAPARSGDIAVQIDLSVRASDNAPLNSLDSLSAFKSKLKNGLGIASSKFKLKFAEVKDVTLTPKTPAKNFIQALVNSGVSSVNVQVIVKVIRKGDIGIKTSKSTVAVPVSAS